MHLGKQEKQKNKNKFANFELKQGNLTIHLFENFT